MSDLTDRGRALEEQWFDEKDKELLAAMRKRREDRLAAQTSEEREQRKKLHHMRCPKCGDSLAEVAVQGVKVDRCANCEGIFLDANELEDLTSKSLAERRGILRSLLGF